MTTYRKMTGDKLAELLAPTPAFPPKRSSELAEVMFGPSCVSAQKRRRTQGGLGEFLESFRRFHEAEWLSTRVCDVYGMSFRCLPLSKFWCIPRGFSGVYIFVNGMRSPLYVGQSENVPGRIPAHRRKKPGMYDHSEFICLKRVDDEESRREIEDYLIDTIDPPFNGKGALLLDFLYTINLNTHDRSAV